MTTQVIGLIGAMDEEVEILLSQLENKETAVRAGVTYASGTIHGKSVVVCKSGVGKVNAAVTTQILIDTYGVSKILFTGVAGARTGAEHWRYRHLFLLHAARYGRDAARLCARRDSVSGSV